MSSRVQGLMDQISRRVGAVSGIGFSVTFKERTSNVATLTTGAAHGYSADDKVLVKIGDSDFDGYVTVLSAPTTTTFTYANTGGNVASTAVTNGMTSKRVSQGKRRWDTDEDLLADVRGLTQQSQGHFAFWLHSRSVPDNSTNPMGPTEVHGRLLVRLDKDTTTDANTMYDLLESITAVLAVNDNFCAAAAIPDGIEYGEAEIDEDFVDNIAIWEFSIKYKLTFPE